MKPTDVYIQIASNTSEVCSLAKIALDNQLYIKARMFYPWLQTPEYIQELAIAYLNDAPVGVCLKRDISTENILPVSNFGVFVKMAYRKLGICKLLCQSMLDRIAKYDIIVDYNESRVFNKCFPETIFDNKYKKGSRLYTYPTLEKIPSKTVITMIGPSNCGKSFTSQQILRDAQKNGMTCTICSSDENRRTILGYNAHKHDPAMMDISDKAFNMLDEQVQTACQNNIDVVVVDSTGLDHRFRNRINDFAEQHSYHKHAIIFNFSDSDEYYQDMDELTLKHVIDKHVKKLKDGVAHNYFSGYDTVNVVTKRGCYDFK